MTQQFLTQTPLLDFQAVPVRKLISARGWSTLSQADKIGAAYDFVRNEILFGYNSDDALPASKVLADGHDPEMWCNHNGCN